MCIGVLWWACDDHMGASQVPRLQNSAVLALLSTKLLLDVALSWPVHVHPSFSLPFLLRIMGIFSPNTKHTTMYCIHHKLHMPHIKHTGMNPPTQIQYLICRTTYVPHINHTPHIPHSRHITETTQMTYTPRTMHRVHTPHTTHTAHTHPSCLPPW